MFTDAVGYSALTQRDEQLALALLEEQRALVRPLLAHHEGREIKSTGDGLLIEFHSALQAVRCAIELQRALRAHAATQPPGRSLQLRIGIHLGDIELRDGDLYGDGVNIAARIEPLCPPGGVCVSRQVFDQVENKLDVAWISLGPQNLKHIARPLEVFRVRLPWEAAAEPAPAHTGSSSRSRERSVAVLPFVNMSPDPENAYFSDGLTDDILAQLAKIGSLRVISRTSSMRYRNTEKTIREIADELGVATVLEGSARRAGDRVRIVAQLVDAATDENMWTETYDRELDDIFAIQTELATQIAEALKARITQGERARIEKAATRDMRAYTLYLQGRFHWNRRTRVDAERAIACFREAIQLDPAFAEAHAGLADALFILVQHNPPNAELLLSQAEDAARRALQLDEALAEAHASLGAIADQRLDWPQAEGNLRVATELNPNYATARHWYALLLAKHGRLGEALEQIQRACELDPQSFIIRKATGHVYYLAREYGRAVEELLAAMHMDPSLSSEVHLELGKALLCQGRFEEALAQFTLHGERGTKASFRTCVSEILAAFARERLGQRGALREAVERWEAEPDTSVLYGALALGRIELGDVDPGFSWMEKAFAEQRASLVFAKVEPFMDSVRDDPRFLDLLRRLGLT